MTDDTRFDTWLSKYPRLDNAYTNVHVYVWTRIRKVRAFFDFEDRRFFASWKPGVTYLDHGYEPCALIEKDEYGDLTGVSLIDGRLIGGCSIYNCGPEIVSLKEARQIADFIKKMKVAATQA